MKVKYLMSAFVSLLASGSLVAQDNQLDWANSIGGTSGNDQGRAITVADNGDVYTAGKFGGTVDFDKGTGVHTMTSNGAYDAYIVKTNSAGTFIWAKQFGGTTGSDYGTALEVDASGVYLGGVFKGSGVEFDAGAGSTTLSSAGTNIDAFILKMDTAGNFMWASKYGGTSGDGPNDFVLDGIGNLYIAGHFNSGSPWSSASFGPSISLSNTANQWGSGQYEDAIVARMDTTGNFIWVKQFGASGQSRAEGITVDSQGNVIVTGWFKEEIDLDPTAGSLIADCVGDRDIFYAKLDTAGNVAWAKTHGAWSTDQGRSVVCDKDDNIYITGTFSGSIDFNYSATATDSLTSDGGKDLYLQKLTPAGNFIWVKQIGGVANTFPKDLNIDSFGYLYVTGTTAGALVDHNPGVGIDTTAYFGGQDIFIDKLDVDGNFVWAKAYGSTGGDQSFQSFVDDAGNYYTTGFYLDTVDFNYGAGLDTLVSSHNGTVHKMDAFFLKLESSCSTPFSSSETIMSCGAYTWAANDSTYQLDGVYTEVLGSMYGCDSIVTLNLTISNIIDVTVSINSGNLIANATGMVYQWLDCDNGYAAIVGDTSATFIPSVSGNYAVSIDDGTCVDTSACYSVIGVGVNDLALNSNVSFYPIPVSDILTINYQDASDLQIKVLDMTGRVLVNTTSNQQITEIDLSSLSAGIYYVTVFENGALLTKKIVKQ